MDNLSEELLVNIFKNLPQKDLINVTCVNSIFNNVITNYKLITTIFITNKTIENSPTRKYSKALIKANNAASYKKAFEATGDSIKEVKFLHHSTTLPSIVSILNLLTSRVKVILFDYISLENEEEIYDGIVQPLNDVNFMFYETNPVLFKAFHQVSISKIDLRFYGDVPYYNFTDFVPFMKNQKELKSFSMSGIYECNLMYGTIPRGDFKLKEFSIAGSDLEDYQYLETFLADHTDTLERITVKRITSWDCSNIIKSCGNLRAIKLTETKLDDLQETLLPVKELIVQLPMNNVDKFPNVEKLSVRNTSVEANQVLTNVMKNVTDLSLNFGVCEGILMENVTKLSLMNISDLTPQFFVQHNKIVNLNLENAIELTDELLSAVVDNLSDKLEILRIHGFNKLTVNALTIIKKCKKLKVFDTKIWSQQFKNNEWVILGDMNGLKTYYETFNF